ncbi:energy-coupled thiamine transporter ThiT [Sutcliffiella halmapala]|uniref:energy-coupled thiamine transporter ThiT n=1 Tax=Sutcliffiella halmapala TaxID=79882 RepID=UPI000994E1E1|nr:energy-coupled thiamine transporter ThiT [Sutcliffiella halmapala]
MKKSNTLFLVEIAIFGALSYLLDLLAGLMSFKIWAQGGSISIAMVPVFIMAFRWGLKGGLLTGFILGLLQLIIGPIWGVHFIQIFLDYIVAFVALGFAGVFAKQVVAAVKENNFKKVIYYVTFGSFIGCLLRFFAHYIAGVIFFSQLAPEGQPIEIYSLLYNGSFMLPSFILSTIVCLLIIKTAPRIFTFNKSVS